MKASLQQQPMYCSRDHNYPSRASFMFFMTPCESLSTIVKHSGLTGWPVELLWWCTGDGALRCSLSLSPKVLLDSPIYSSGQLMCGHLNLYMNLLFWGLLSLSLGAMRRLFMSFWTFPPVCGCKVPLWRCCCCCDCCLIHHCCCC